MLPWWLARLATFDLTRNSLQIQISEFIKSINRSKLYRTLAPIDGPTYDFFVFKHTGNCFFSFGGLPLALSAAGHAVGPRVRTAQVWALAELGDA